MLSMMVQILLLKELINRDIRILLLRFRVLLYLEEILQTPH
nr:MAG TPA: hypothetical protein [Caudoviricetes sp.]